MCQRVDLLLLTPRWRITMCLIKGLYSKKKEGFQSLSAEMQGGHRILAGRNVKYVL